MKKIKQNEATNRYTCLGSLLAEVQFGIPPIAIGAIGDCSRIHFVVPRLRMLTQTANCL